MVSLRGPYSEAVKEMASSSEYALPHDNATPSSLPGNRFITLDPAAKLVLPELFPHSQLDQVEQTEFDAALVSSTCFLSGI